MNKITLYLFIILFSIQTKGQNLELIISPDYLSFENDLPVLGYQVFKSKNPKQIIICIYTDDDVKLNVNSNLIIQLENNDIIPCDYMTAEQANRNIIINSTYTTWHFKKQPQAIFTISEIFIDKLKAQSLKRLVLYKVNSANNPEKVIYDVSPKRKDSLRGTLIVDKY